MCEAPTPVAEGQLRGLGWWSGKADACSSVPSYLLCLQQPCNKSAEIPLVDARASSVYLNLINNWLVPSPEPNASNLKEAVLQCVEG